MMNYKPKMKNVIDSSNTELDSMNSLRMSIVQKVLANTAKNLQLEEVGDCITEAAEKAIAADSIIVKVGDKINSFEHLSFMAKWERDKWFGIMANLFTLLIEENCWYEDKLSNGFCWRNNKREFCSLEIG